MRLMLMSGFLLLMSCGRPGLPESRQGTTVSRGERIYMMRCATCHQRNGSGTLRNFRFAADFTDPNGVLVRSDEELIHSIMEGVDGTYGRMPGFKPILREEDVVAVLDFIRTQFQAPVEPRAPAGP